MKAIVLNCTLKSSPAVSNTEALARVVTGALESEGVETEFVRIADFDVKPGVTMDEGNGDQWPQIVEKVLGAEILILATPIWLGQISSVAKRVLERFDALLSETDDEGRPVAFNRVAGFVVTGNEDGAHHCIAELAQGVGDMGWTVPPQAFTYWNMGPGPGPDYLDTDHGHEWSETTGKAAASNLLGVARALQATPIPAPPS